MQQCNASTQAGHDGVTNTIHTLGRGGPLVFTLTHETENVPDRIEVFYQARRIFDTGYVGDDTNEGTGSARVAVPPGLSGSVLVRVSGGTDTDWEYTVGCPS